mgnify:FL=1
MNLPGYYSSGAFAKKAHITKKTLRYYDEHNILKPSLVTEKGARFYTDEDFARLQQILFLKYLGFALDDVKEMTVRNSDPHFMAESLHMQLGLIEERMGQLELMKNALLDAKEAVDAGEEVDWSQMLQFANVNEMEQKLKKQYQNVSNISARIHLHSEFSQNEKGWFEWVYEQCGIQKTDRILELGCGDASLWLKNKERLPENINVVLTDISDGIIRDAKKTDIGKDDRFTLEVMDAHHINAPDNSFDFVIANHVLFYCENLDKVCSEVYRVLKPGGTFVCSTYGNSHMKEISELVQEFDERIVLSADKLYEVFGESNGAALLKNYFKQVEWRQYEDCLLVTKAESLIAYILSCHGNQNRYIVDRYSEFRNFVRKKTERGFLVTKDAGVFVAKV